MRRWLTSQVGGAVTVTGVCGAMSVSMTKLEPVGAGRRVLLVDDEPLLVASYRRTLARARFAVLTADDGEDACQLLARDSVDIVVSDVQMPRMTGLELLAAVRVRIASLPVVLMTATPTAALRAAAASLGVTAVLEKPVVNHDLIAIVRGALTVALAV